MDAERLAAEYVKLKAHSTILAKQVDELKALLTKQVDREGIPDEKGHLWFTAGEYLLQRQKRQGDKYLDKPSAEEWARRKGIWEDVKMVTESLSEDALLGYVYERRRTDPALEAELEDLYITPPPTWAFMPPVVQKPYEY